MRIAPVRWLAVSLCLAFLAVVPRVVAAAPLYVTVALPLNYGNLEFGPGLGFARILDQGLGQDDDALWGPNGESFEIVGGVLNLWTGPLLDVTADGFDATYSHAGEGTLSIVFDLGLPNGSIHHGTFVAPLGPQVVFADSQGGGGDTLGTIGEGLFDADTARLLGINRHTLNGVLSLFLDSYDSYPEPYRVAKSFGYIDIPVVPEPTLLSLAAMAIGAAAFRCRRRALTKR